ncbi:MAG: hypothetical protein AAF750_05065 [Planctomycetota bacterium]
MAVGTLYGAVPLMLIYLARLWMAMAWRKRRGAPKANAPEAQGWTRQAAWWVTPGAPVFAALLIGSGLPLTVAVSVSGSSLEAEAQRRLAQPLPAATAPATDLDPDQWFGVIRTHRIEREGGVVRFATGGFIMSESGLAFSPHQPPVSAIPAGDGSYHYVSLGKGWYRYHVSF